MKLDTAAINSIIADGECMGREAHSLQAAIVEAVHFVSLGAQEACDGFMVSALGDGKDVVEVFSGTATNRAANSMRALAFLLELCKAGLVSVLEDVPHVGRILIECALALLEEPRSLANPA